MHRRLKPRARVSDVLLVETGRLDAAAVRDGLDTLLRVTPHARATAIDARGVFVPMPGSLALPGARRLPGRSAVLLVEPDDRAAVITAWESVRETGATRTRVHLAGSGAEATLYMFDLREQHGVLVGVMVADDAALHEDVAEAAPYVARFAVQRKSDTAVFVEIDDATTSMLGWQRDEMVGRPSLDFVHDDDRTQAVESWIDMLASPGCTRRVRLRYHHADGRWCWLELTNHNHLDDPAIACVVTECLDVSDEMAAHEALRSREELLRRIAETVPLGLVKLDVDGSVVYSNERLYDILHSAATDDDPLVHVDAHDRVAFDDAFAALVADGVDRDLHIVVSPRDGEESRVCEVSLRALRGDGDAVTGAIACFEDVTERLRDQVELENRATYDALTGVRNRRSILQVLDEFGAVEPRVGVVFVDFDDFKRVNDAYGHAVGDGVLVELAARLRECVRENDIVGRLGGDEFLVVCPGAGDATDMLKVAHRIAGAINAPLRVPGGDIVMTASIGVAMAYEAGPDVAMAVANADAAMYVAKRRGDGRPVAHAAPAVDDLID